MEVGLRVVRGPNWKWDDQDGGEGHVGTVVKYAGSDILSISNTATVQWDCGVLENYRIGHQNAYDLLILDNAPLGVKHQDIACDSCKKDDIAGMRWECKQCDDFDLCTQCYMSDKHDLTHQFLRFETPDDLYGVEMPKREGAKKLQMKGIFPSARVIRGPDWDWGHQDGREGTFGTVINIQGWGNKSERSVATVTWHSRRGFTNLYRIGYNGKVDLKCIIGAVGGYYYKNHLPTLKTYKSAQTKGSKNRDIIVKERKNRKGFMLLRRHLEDLFISGQFSDFTIKVKDHKFQIHKAILAARSSVFASMLQHDMKEKNTGFVELFDCDPVTFENFLFYVYTGKVERISHKNVTSLYAAAEKYDVQGLKKECIYFMRKNLSVDIFCDVMALAVMYSDKDLIERATEYFISHTQEILFTVKWQIFVKENPVPANELYIKSFKTVLNKN